MVIGLLQLPGARQTVALVLLVGALTWLAAGVLDGQADLGVTTGMGVQWVFSDCLRE
jgi:low temperature requirement protein LtrA